MPQPNPPAVIVGFEANGLGVARALKREGIDVIALGTPTWSDAYATRCASVTRSSAWREDAVVDDLLELGKRIGRRAPLLITKDEPVAWVSNNRDVLGEHFHIALPSAETVDVLLNKDRFGALAQEHGWPLPRTWVVGSEADLAALAPAIPQPCILKPAFKGSEFRRRSPFKAFKIGSAAELLEAYRRVSAWESHVLIQEWIGGGDDRVAFCLGYWDSASHPAGVFAGHKIRQWPPECGNTSSAEPAPSEWRSEIIRTTVAVFEAVDYRGLGSVEFKVAADGRCVIMEPTVGRTNYQNEVAVVNGVNLPALAYFDALGLADRVEQLQATAALPHSSTKLVDLSADVRSARFYMKRGELRLFDWLRSLRGQKREMIGRLNDPGPAAVAIARACLGGLRRIAIGPVLRAGRWALRRGLANN